MEGMCDSADDQKRKSGLLPVSVLYPDAAAADADALSAVDPALHKLEDALEGLGAVAAARNLLTEGQEFVPADQFVELEGENEVQSTLVVTTGLVGQKNVVITMSL
jgi:hypothetical protein